MPFDLFIALVTLAVVMAFTPGPNNALVANSSATFGMRRTVPHILGIALGFSLMNLVVGLFLGELFQRSAILRETLRWGGVLLLLYLAWKVARSGGISSVRGEPRPFTFLEAASFQWINPKAWSFCIAINTQFISPEAPWRGALIVSAVLVVVGLASASSWAFAGQAIRLWVDTPGRLRVFNMVMGLTIAACVVLIIVE